MPQNLIEKIVQAHAVDLAAGQTVHSGDLLTVRPVHVMTHDNTAPVMAKFAAIGARNLHAPRQPVFCLDHDVQNRSPENLTKYRRIEEFARQHGISFYPAGRGIGHQVMCEEGFVLPCTMVVASDSHANIYGGLGALGTPVVRTDAAAIWATGTTWFQVPPVTRVELTGALRPGVTGKDVIITLCGHCGNDEVLNHAVEFTGDGVATLTIDDRLTIANMTTEWGALAGVFPCDAATLTWLTGCQERLAGDDGNHGDLTEAELNRLRADPPAADPAANYDQIITLDLRLVVPVIAGPDQVREVTPLAGLQQPGLPINKAYLLSCVNGRADDFSLAASVIRGRRVAPGVEFYIAAASSEIEAEARRRGDWQILLAAGATPLPAGCGPCIGLGAGTLGDNEVGISGTNRNFKGRMGSRSARAFLASPAVVAASAVAGRITAAETLAPPASEGPADGDSGAVGASPVNIVRPPVARVARPAVTMRSDFPPRLQGELLFLDADNLNTDGIFGKEVTYRDDLTPEQLAGYAMANYDPGFQALAMTGDILVGGYNFGTGSSREQAATCLKYRGIQLVIAGSFSATYKRNAFNNGYICLECPGLVDALRRHFGDDRRPTRRTGWMATIDFAGARAEVAGKSYPTDRLGTAAQDLVLAGGLEAWARARGH